MTIRERQSIKTTTSSTTTTTTSNSNSSSSNCKEAKSHKEMTGRGEGNHNTKNNQRGFKHTILFVGYCLFASFLLFFLCSYYVTPKVIKKAEQKSKKTMRQQKE